MASTRSNVPLGRGSEKAFIECPWVSNVFPSAAEVQFWLLNNAELNKYNVTTSTTCAITISFFLGFPGNVDHRTYCDLPTFTRNRHLQNPLCFTTLKQPYAPLKPQCCLPIHSLRMLPLLCLYIITYLAQAFGRTTP